MSQENVAGKYYLGRRVVDNYGKTVGKIIGYYTSDKGSPPLLGIELLEGDFKALPSTSAIDEANILVVDENWKTKAERLAQDMTLIKRKIFALNKLYKSGEVNSDAYEGLEKSFEAMDQDLKSRCENLFVMLGERSKALSVTLKDITGYFINVKLEHEIGDMDDEAYRVSGDALRDLINRLQAEQKDIEFAQESLQQTSTPLPKEEQPLEKPSLVEPKVIPSEVPIVLRIREAGE